MNFANSNAVGNLVSMDSPAVHETLQAIDSIAESLKQAVLGAAENGESFDSLERRNREIAFQLGHQALELFIRMQGKGDLGPEVSTPNGQTLHSSKKKR